MKYLDLTGLQKLWTKIKTHVQTSLEGYAKTTDLFSKNYNDLTNKPTIPTDYTVITLSADSGTLTADQLAKLKANPHKIVFVRSGFYYFAENLSSSSTWYYSCNVYYSGSNIIKRVLTITTASGAYTKTDYTYTPPTYTHPSEHPASMITGLATVATSGSYNDLTDKPTIPSGGGTNTGSTTLPFYDFSNTTLTTVGNFVELVMSMGYIEGAHALTKIGGTIYAFSISSINSTDSKGDWRSCKFINLLSLKSLSFSLRSDYNIISQLSSISNDNTPSGNTSVLDELADHETRLTDLESTIIDLGTQENHKQAQEAMVYHLEQAKVGCYLFKYYCPCYDNACFAVVKKTEFFVEGTVYDSARSLRTFNYNITDECYDFDGCWVTLASFHEELPLHTENKTVIDAINELNAKVGSGGGAGLSMPRIRFANWKYTEGLIFSESEDAFIAGRIVFSVNVQDGTLQEGDELQVCALKDTFGKKKLRPILSKTITTVDLENLAKQPYLQISTDDYAFNTLGSNFGRALISLMRTDSGEAFKNKSKYIRIRRPVWKENMHGDVVVVNASFSNVVPVEIALKYGLVE